MPRARASRRSEWQREQGKQGKQKCGERRSEEASTRRDAGQRAGGFGEAHGTSIVPAAAPPRCQGGGWPRGGGVGGAHGTSTVPAAAPARCEGGVWPALFMSGLVRDGCPPADVGERAPSPPARKQDPGAPADVPRPPYGLIARTFTDVTAPNASRSGLPGGTSVT